MLAVNKHTFRMETSDNVHTVAGSRKPQRGESVNDSQTMSMKVLTGLQVGSWVATILLVPLLGWALTTILDLDTRVTRVETREEQYITAADQFDMQAQVSELALTTQAAIEALRSQVDDLRADLEERRR